jgi:hypothetical protein
MQRLKPESVSYERNLREVILPATEAPVEQEPAGSWHSNVTTCCIESYALFERRRVYEKVVESQTAWEQEL